MGEPVSTICRVMISGATSEPERQLIRKWADWCASNGGSFGISQKWEDQQWWVTYTLNWPDRESAAAALGEKK